jgi:hypothetical protein
MKINRMFDVLHRGTVLFLAGNAVIGNSLTHSRTHSVSLIHSPNYSLSLLIIYWSLRSLTHSLTHSNTRAASLTHSLIHTLTITHTHSLTHSLTGFGWLIGGGALNMIQYKLNPEQYTHTHSPAAVSVDVDAALAAADKKE